MLGFIVCAVVISAFIAMLQCVGLMLMGADIDKINEAFIESMTRNNFVSN